MLFSLEQTFPAFQLCPGEQTSPPESHCWSGLASTAVHQRCSCRRCSNRWCSRKPIHPSRNVWYRPAITQSPCPTATPPLKTEFALKSFNASSQNGLHLNAISSNRHNAQDGFASAPANHYECGHAPAEPTRIDNRAAVP